MNGYSNDVSDSFMYDNQDPESKFKTELCKNWVDTGICRYGKKCKFAHGYDELSDHVKPKISNDKLKTKNCRTFYNEKVCLYGERCMFRHEHRQMRQIFRHFYVPHLIVLEQLYS